MTKKHEIVIKAYFNTSTQAGQAKEKYENKLRDNLSCNCDEAMYFDSVKVYGSFLKIAVGFELEPAIKKAKEEVLFKKTLQDIKEDSVNIEKFLLSVEGLVSIKILDRLLINEVLELCGKNTKLQKALLKIQSNKNEENRLLSVYEYFGNWDAEDSLNFDEPTLGLKSNVDDWTIYPLLKGVSKLFDNYNWPAIKLSDDRYLFVSKYKEVYIIKGEIEDSGVEKTAWNINVNELPESAKNALWGKTPELKDKNPEYIMNVTDLQEAEKQSVVTEEYEKAAVFRDEIKKRKINTK